MKRSLVLISFVLWIVVVYAGSSTLKAKCMELDGTYFRQKCYTYQNETRLKWNDAMDFCNNLVSGFTSHLVHLLSSKTLNVLYDLTRPIPTGVHGERTMDIWVDTSNWGMIMYKKRDKPPYPWERGDISEFKRMYFFCQTNEQYTTSGILRTEFNRINKPPMLATLKKNNTLDCLWECRKHALCRGFNYKSSESKCELTSWDAEDVAPDGIDNDNEWRHYLVE